MNLDHVVLELRTREEVRVPLSRFPLVEGEEERVKAARRLIRSAGKEIAARVRTVHARQAGVVIGFVDRERPEWEMRELLADAAERLDFDQPADQE